MICYVMLCYVMLCYVMLCYVMLCYVMLCYVMLCYVMLCYVKTVKKGTRQICAKTIGSINLTNISNANSASYYCSNEVVIT